MNKIYLLIILLLIISCVTRIESKSNDSSRRINCAVNLPRKENFWIFLMAGQSNMAGRALVEPIDTIQSLRVCLMDKENKWIVAKEPLHFYEPSMAGLDCGMSFGKELSASLGDSIYIGLIPCAVGASSIEQWVGDSLHRGVHLFSNFRSRAELATKVGTIKGILWHQGENNANQKQFKDYDKNLQELFLKFRGVAQNDSLPILVGELGKFLRKQEFGNYPDSINNTLKHITDLDKNIMLIKTNDLNHKGDFLHFDSQSQRTLGKRFAETLKMKLTAAKLVK